MEITFEDRREALIRHPYRENIEVIAQSLIDGLISPEQMQDLCVENFKIHVY